MRATLRTILACAALAMALSCEEPGALPPYPGFPDDDGWREARTPCVLSHDHDLTYVRVWADGAAYAPYTEHATPYPEGARLLKGLYRDELCEELLGFVTMEKLATGAAPADFDWRWRRFDASGREVFDRRRIPETCTNCHQWHCGAPPGGWDYTCIEGGPEPSNPLPTGG